MAEPIIKVNNLKVIYNPGKSNEVRSLDDVSLEIFPEEYIIIYGPSGCGKSTLLYSIAGLQAPTSGEAIVNGKELSKMKKKEMVDLHRHGIGLIFQAFYLIPTIHVLFNVCLPKIFQGISKKERQEVGMQLLRRFGIAEQARKFPGQLSGGQKQRVAIARSLINNPGIILADEPVGNLDSESAENVMNILRELNEIDKKTVILVTHNAEHLHYANRVIYMKDGKIVKEEVHKEKRPKEALDKEIAQEAEKISEELKLLMRIFKNFSPEQAGALLIPYKAKQLLNYLVSEFTEDQLSAAENFMKDLMFKNINIDLFGKNLDMDLEEGGAGWNKTKAKNFSARVESILKQAELLEKKDPGALDGMLKYLSGTFGLEMDQDVALRLGSFLKLRIENRIDFSGLQERFDAPIEAGGLGLHKSTAEKMAREIEIIMLLKYSA